MNLQSLLAHNDPKPLTYHNPKNLDESPLILMVHSNDSRVYKQAFRESQIKVFELVQNANNIVEIDGKKNLSIELQNKLSIEVLAKLVVDWDGLMDGKNKVPFNRDLLIKIMTDNIPLTNAIDTFCADIEGKYQA